MRRTADRDGHDRTSLGPEGYQATRSPVTDGVTGDQPNSLSSSSASRAQSTMDTTQRRLGRAMYLADSPCIGVVEPAPGPPLRFSARRRVGIHPISLSTARDIRGRQDQALGADRHRPQPCRGQARSGGYTRSASSRGRGRIVYTTRPTPDTGYGKARAHARFPLYRKRRPATSAGRLWFWEQFNPDQGPTPKRFTLGVRTPMSISEMSSLSISKSPSISKISCPGAIGLPGPVRDMIAV